MVVVSGGTGAVDNANVLWDRPECPVLVAEGVVAAPEPLSECVVLYLQFSYFGVLVCGDCVEDGLCECVRAETGRPPHPVVVRHVHQDYVDTRLVLVHRVENNVTVLVQVVVG